MTVHQNFWSWFVKRELALFNFDPVQQDERERLFDELASELRKIDPDLAFEFGPKAPRREFVISAGGIRRAFPAVISLVTAAPTLERWQVIAFRPRRTPNIVEFRGKRVHPKDVHFSLLDNERPPGIYLFIPDFREDDADLKQIGYLLLDETLGEYDVESRLGLIKMLSPDSQTDGERYQLAELAARFDQLVSQLEGRLSKPS
jgi:hypothetical protein